MGTEYQLRMMEGSAEGLWEQLHSNITALSATDVHSKRAKMVSFMLCIFYNKKLTFIALIPVYKSFTYHVKKFCEVETYLLEAIFCIQYTRNVFHSI